MTRPTSLHGEGAELNPMHLSMENYIIFETHTLVVIHWQSKCICFGQMCALASKKRENVCFDFRVMQESEIFPFNICSDTAKNSSSKFWDYHISPMVLSFTSTELVALPGVQQLERMSSRLNHLSSREDVIAIRITRKHEAKYSEACALSNRNVTNCCPRRTNVTHVSSIYAWFAV